MAKKQDGSAPVTRDGEPAKALVTWSGYYGPEVVFYPSLRDAASLVNAWMQAGCAGCGAIFVRERGEWVAA